MKTHGRFRAQTWSVLVLIGCLVVVAAATAVTAISHRDTEQRLLDQRTLEEAALVTTALPGIQTPLAAAAELAEATDGAQASFDAVMSRSIDTAQFVSAVLFSATTMQPVADVGEPTALATADAGRTRAMIEQAVATDDLSVVDTLDLPGRRLGYAFTAASGTPTFVVYAETALALDATGAPRPTGAFADLDFALYLGDGEQPGDLLLTSVEDPPIDGRRSSTVVPFGDTQALLVTGTDTVLGSRLSARLPWYIAGLGTAIALVAAGAAERLMRRRQHAERLAIDLSRLYDEQRHRSETLQRSLLPAGLDTPPNVTAAARYWPAGGGVEIGGDFYDLFPLGGDRWAIAIGDVCGHGIEAAALTGVTRHTIRAAARHLRSPAEVLRWTHDAIRSYSGETYCTVCFAFLTVEPNGGFRLDLSLGGHPGPVLYKADGSVRVLEARGTLLGLFEPTLATATYHLSPGDVLVLYTDGITDAPRGQAMSIDELQDIVGDYGDGSPERIADGIRDVLEARRGSAAGDDAALLILRFGGQSDGSSEEPSAGFVAHDAATGQLDLAREADAFEERAIMGDQEHGATKALERRLQLLDRR